MEYSQKTADLIERQCRNVEREDFTLNKKAAEEALLKTYDIFGLARPKKIVWLKDIFDKKFIKVLDSAWNAWSARSASSARNAWIASSASSARNAWSASSARSAWSAWIASSAWIALDYDFEWYVFEFEYCQNPTEEKPNENDHKYLEYCELLMQAKEHGMGYRIEWEDVLYCVPTPIVRIDNRNRFHSIKEPAIRWKGGAELHYINGVLFEKKLWQKVFKGKLKPQEVFAIENTEQRRITYELMDKKKMLKLNDYKVLDEVKDDGKGSSMKIISFTVSGFDKPFVYYNCFCPTTSREYFLQTDKEKCAEAKDASFGLAGVEWVNEW